MRRHLMVPPMAPAISGQSTPSNIYMSAAGAVELPASLSLAPETFHKITSSVLRRFDQWSGSQILLSPYLRTKHVLLALMMDEVFKKLMHGTFEPSYSRDDEMFSDLFSHIVSALKHVESHRLKDLNSRGTLNNLTLRSKMAETWQILEKEFQGIQQFSGVPALHRWKFIVEPAVRDALRLLDIDMDSNPLQGFIFDTEPEYAYRLARCLHTALVDTTRPLDLSLLNELSGIFDAHIAGPGMGFAANFSKQGTMETVTYMMELARESRITTMLIQQNTNVAVVCRPKNTNPARAIYRGRDENKRPIVENEMILNDIKAATEMLVVSGDWPDSINCIFFRDKRSSRRLQEKLNHIFDEYGKRFAQESISEDADSKLRAALKVYVECERLHVFNDSNYRIFGIVVLNFLLAKQGQSFTTLYDPNHSDGSSLDELLDQAKAGQQMWDDFRKT